MNTVLYTTLCDKVYQCTPASSTNKTDLHDIIEILLKVVLNTLIDLNQYYIFQCVLPWDLDKICPVLFYHIVHPQFLVGFVLLDL
jgi:hypothetical protein